MMPTMLVITVWTNYTPLPVRRYAAKGHNLSPAVTVILIASCAVVAPCAFMHNYGQRVGRDLQLACVIVLHPSPPISVSYKNIMV